MKTAMHDIHRDLGATFTEFMGYEMPLQYTSVQEEHITVRKKVGLFDVSHMGAIFVRGKDAEHLVSKITVERAENIKNGMGQYTVILDNNGHILDDELFFRVGTEFLFIPNSGRHTAISAWMQKHADGDVEIDDVSDGYSILAVQGPHSGEIVSKVITRDIDSIKFFGFLELSPDDFSLSFEGRCIISRTGYTGEKGYELYIHPADAAREIFISLLEAGKPQGIMPIGLAARDTLRLEKGFMLAGNEFAGGRNPIEANLGWCINWDHEFIGKEALLAFKQKTNYETMAPLECMGKGIPRHGDAIFKNETKVGIVTSGTFSPCLKEGIALSYVNTMYATEGETLSIHGRRHVTAHVIKGPFVKKGAC